MQTTSPEFDFLDLPDDQILAMASQPIAAVTPSPSPESASDAGENRGETSVGDGSTPPASAGEANANDDTEVSTSVFDKADDDEEGIKPAPVVAKSAPVSQAEPIKVPTAEELAAQKLLDDAAAAEAAKNTAPPADDTAPKPATADDHKAFYDRVLGQPIKANGKEIQLQSPEEAVKLIQMGLNYTKKMQAMQPGLRVVKMLENNGLMDESKLSHLIDISKGDSAAIQKLLADKGFNTLEADAEQAAKYVPADHRVTDLEMKFNAVLDDVQQSSTGVELISEVHGQWDADSKRALFERPEILAQLAEQKAHGLYAQISGEVDRLRALGQITPDIPFLQAYHAVGDMLHTQGRLVPKQEVTPPPAAVVAPVEPVETRVAAPTPVVKNTAQAQATAPVRTAPSNTKPAASDYLSMPDEEFAKQTAGRF